MASVEGSVDGFFSKGRKVKFFHTYGKVAEEVGAFRMGVSMVLKGCYPLE